MSRATRKVARPAPTPIRGRNCMTDVS
jgi:hypothetical protein